MPAKTHTMHGRDHVAQGADPVPGLVSVPAGGYASYPIGVQSFPSLKGYWPLDDGPFAGTPSFRDLGPLSPSRALTHGGSGVAMTDDYTPGPLETGDQGAVAFNATGPTNVIVLTSSGDPDSPLGRYDQIHTIAAWIKPLADTHAWSGGIVSNANFNISYFGGWRLYVDWPALNLMYRADDGSGSPACLVNGGALTVGVWTHVVATVDMTSGVVGKLYRNGNQVATASVGSFGLPALRLGVTVGECVATSAPTYGDFKGGIAHVALWGNVLSGANVMTLYQSGNLPDAGTTVVADGSGGWTTAPPRTFYLNGA
jgi:hypothetical protein